MLTNALFSLFFGLGIYFVNIKEGQSCESFEKEAVVPPSQEVLPPELWVHIFSYLDVASLQRAEKTCKKFWQFSIEHHKDIWYHTLPVEPLGFYPNCIIPRHKEQFCDWRIATQLFHRINSDLKTHLTESSLFQKISIFLSLTSEPPLFQPSLPEANAELFPYLRQVMPWNQDLFDTDEKLRDFLLVYSPEMDDTYIQYAILFNNDIKQATSIQLADINREDSTLVSIPLQRTNKLLTDVLKNLACFTSNKGVEHIIDILNSYIWPEHYKNGKQHKVIWVEKKIGGNEWGVEETLLALDERRNFLKQKLEALPNASFSEKGDIYDIEYLELVYLWGGIGHINVLQPEDALRQRMQDLRLFGNKIAELVVSAIQIDKFKAYTEPGCNSFLPEYYKRINSMDGINALDLFLLPLDCCKTTSAKDTLEKALGGSLAAQRELIYRSKIVEVERSLIDYFTSLNFLRKHRYNNIYNYD